MDSGVFFRIPFHTKSLTFKEFNFFIGSLLGARPRTVSSVINKFLTTRSQFNFFYFLHKTIFFLYNWLITYSCRHLTDIKHSYIVTQNLLIMHNPNAEQRTCTAWQLYEKHNAQYKNKYINSHSAKQNWKKKNCYRYHSSSQRSLSPFWFQYCWQSSLPSSEEIFITGNSFCSALWKSKSLLSH